ncbi:MAG TPA: membrane protein insertion efficiency factor YidD [Patescibacteria group bacterium]|nr:membrane protein insertion efficiency factor YidD [Patescibacteria group bacterium]
MKHVLAFLITVYQNTETTRRFLLAPFLGETQGVCRFEPHCSEYAKQSITKHGVFRGGLLSIRRIVRCNPLAKGGMDLVV